jgi:hypothetical protein
MKIPRHTDVWKADAFLRALTFELDEGKTNNTARLDAPLKFNDCTVGSVPDLGWLCKIRE